jgi:hypothetical protein
MHDLDRAMFETAQGNELDGSREVQALEQQEFLEVLGELVGEVGYAPGTQGQPFRSSQGETEQTELALELLEVSTEQELDRFVGNLIGRAAGAVRDFARSPTGQALKGIVKSAAGQALPVVGRAVGSWIAPGYGDMGARVGRAAGDLLGLELEGLSQEDRELETAEALVRWASEATRRAASMSSQAPPGRVAKAAAVAAAQRIAPGLAPVVGQMRVPGASGAGVSPGVPPSQGARPSPAAQSGRWVRRGNAVVLLGF